MKKLLTVLIICLLSFSANAQYDSIPHDILSRKFLLRLPSSYNGSTKLPLVIVMHGGFGTPFNVENQSQFTPKGEANNFIVVYPEGSKSLLGIRTWNAGGCCGASVTKNVDDIGFINALLDTLMANYTIDSSRVYATGMSNGGFMSYRLACELSNRIAAIAPVSAGMIFPTCNPSRSIPVIHFHSYADLHIPALGGVGSGPSTHYNPPLDSTLNIWSGLNNCLTTNDTTYTDSNYTVIKWSNCDCTTEQYAYLTQDGGHSWHGGNKTITGDSVSVYVNATDVMWTFFQQYNLSCLTNINEITKKPNFKIYPNPFSNYTTIEFSAERNSTKSLRIINLLGESTYEKTDINSSTFILNKNGLKAGIYLVELWSNQQRIETQKLVVK